jgi:hypothetical protein
MGPILGDLDKAATHEFERNIGANLAKWLLLRTILLWRFAPLSTLPTMQFTFERLLVNPKAELGHRQF